MRKLRVYALLRVMIAIGGVIYLSPCCAIAAVNRIQKINGVLIPQAFSLALQDGMTIPLFIHLNSNRGSEGDQRIGHASIWLDNETLKIRQIRLDEQEENATVNTPTQQALLSQIDVPFDASLQIELTADARLQFDLKGLNLQLVVRKEALGTVLRLRSEDIGESSVKGPSGTLNYGLGVFNNQMRNGGNNTSSYLTMNSVAALREHHILVDGSLYGIGSGQHDGDVYKALYERDFAGHRFAAGMLDTWNLQSLGPMTAISAGKIYGMSWGNQASSTVFDNSQSITPVIAFLSAAGEVHLSREGRLLSVQNFTMGNHEVDTRGLPYGIYDVDVEVVVNGRVVSKRTERVNKLFRSGRGAGAPLAWQFWGGSIHMSRWSESNKKTKPEKTAWLTGVSASGSVRRLNWAGTAYGYDNNLVVESRLSLPVTESVSVNLQNMAANDGSWSSIGSISAALPGGFSSVWLNHEKTHIGDNLRHSNADNYAVGGTLNMNAWWSKLGTFNVSYNDDRQHRNHYYTASYYQNIFSGPRGSLGIRAGIQRYNNGNSNANTGKYIALDFSLPLGNWLSAGATHQNGYTTANLSARRQFNDGVIRSVGGNVSQAISANTGDDKKFSGGAWAQFDTPYSAGTLNVNSSLDGYVNTSLSANGSLGWSGSQVAASGRNNGNAGVIFRTGVDDGGQLRAKVNGRIVQLTGQRSYVPLSSYGHYDVEIQNSRYSADSYDIVSGRKNRLTLYPGNVAVITPEIKQMVTVSGRIHAEDGRLMSHARINNHIGRTRTDANGEFMMDVDKKHPTIDFTDNGNQRCEVVLDLRTARGAVWVGDVICTGLKTYAAAVQSGEGYES